jgi:transposase
MRYSAPPGYRRQQPVRRPKLGAWIRTIDQILEADKAEGKKQRHTAKRIFERLRDEHNYTGGYTIVKDYVRLRKLSQREMFVPLEHPPGDAQADFGEAMVVIAGVERKAHYLVMDLPQSDDGFVMAFPARRRKRSSKATTTPSPISAACRARSSTTTPRSPLGGSWAMGRG